VSGFVSIQGGPHETGDLSYVYRMQLFDSGCGFQSVREQNDSLLEDHGIDEYDIVG
ncbi:unnamed protein product, partial [Rotaria magnacalcarata]